MKYAVLFLFNLITYSFSLMYSWIPGVKKSPVNPRGQKILSLYKIEKYRKELYRNRDKFVPVEFGAGSKKNISDNLTISDAAKMASINAWAGRYISGIAAQYQPDVIIELGTAFGLGTMYLAAANPLAKVITVEGNPQLANIARKAFDNLEFRNITLIHDIFENRLSALKQSMGKKNLIYIDGNHTYDATLRYFETFISGQYETCIIMLDDINWSLEMMKAWKVIRRNFALRSINHFRMGIVFAGFGSLKKFM